jgi:translation initiation factor IF-3
MFSKKYLLRGARALLQPQHQAASKVSTLRALFTVHRRVMLTK